MNQLLPRTFFDWCHDSVIGAWINDSVWTFAIIETFHILALTVFLGAIVVMNLRLFGIGSRRQEVHTLAREIRPYAITALLVLVATGIPMFMSQAIKYSQSVSFLVKMVLLVVAVVFQFTVYGHVTTTDDGKTRFGKLAASVSLFCWLGVALAGRGIAFLP